MSTKLALSSALAVFAMACALVLGSADHTMDPGANATGAKTLASAPALDRQLPVIDFFGR